MEPRPGSDEADPAGICATAEYRAGDLDHLIQRIFTAGVLLGNALASGAGTVTAVENAIRELDEAVFIIRPVVFRACEPADGLGTLAARLAQAARDLSRLAGTSAGDIDLSLRDAALNVHRAQVAVSEACSAFTVDCPAAAADRALWPSGGLQTRLRPRQAETGVAAAVCVTWPAMPGALSR